MSTLITTKNNKPETERVWQPVQINHGYSNSLMLTKDGNNYTVESEAGRFYTIDEAYLDSELYYGCLAKLHYKVTNNTDLEISRGIAPIFYSLKVSLPLSAIARCCRSSPAKQPKVTL